MKHVGEEHGGTGDGTILFNDFIEFTRLIDVLEMVRQPSTPTILDSYPNEFWLGLIEDVLEVSDCVWSQC
jgi:hypothetical protein